jgi:long-chain acyl-CoA synthetase
VPVAAVPDQAGRHEMEPARSGGHHAPVTLLDLARAAPDAPAVDDGVRRRTRGQLVDRATRAGRLLRTAGVGPGGTVALLLGNRVELVELVTAAVLSGARYTAVNWHLTADEVRYIVADSAAKVLVTEPRYAAVAHAGAAGAGAEVIVAGPQLDDLVDGADDTPFPLDGPAGRSMLYTSGTTGRPKGVVRTGPTTVADQLAALGAVGRGVGLDGGGPHLVTGPLYHAAPLGFAVGDLHAGAELVLTDRFDAAATLRIVDERAVRATHLVPTMFVRLLRLDEAVRTAFDGGSLRTVLHGAAPVSPAVKERMIAWWGPVLVEYWGTSEAGVFTVVGSDDWLEHPGTVGRAVPHYDVVAVGPDGEDLPPGEIGELYCRHTSGSRVFAYHRADDKTDAAHRAGGGFTMGDIGRVDPDGFVYLADRAANVIVSGGVNIYPAEVEHVLVEHPLVADVAVFGVPDDEWGEQVKAAVELRRDAPVASGSPPAGDDRGSAGIEADLIAFARERLAGYKVPRSIDLHDHLPRQPTGKLATRVLRDRYWQGRDRRV